MFLLVRIHLPVFFKCTQAETSPNLSSGLCTILTFKNTCHPLKFELNDSQMCVFSGNIS